MRCGLNLLLVVYEFPVVHLLHDLTVFGKLVRRDTFPVLVLCLGGVRY